MTEFTGCSSALQRSKVIQILKSKVREAKSEGDNFLIYVRNPIKLCLLLSEFLVGFLQPSKHLSFLKYEVALLKYELLRIAG